MKTKVAALLLVAALALSTGCSSKPAADATKQPAQPAQQTSTTAQPADAVTTASIVDQNDAFEKALTAEGGHYIVAILKDLTFDKELVVNGDFKNGKKDANGNEQFQRKIALYAQDANRKVTAKYTLTAPKITFNSNYGSLEHGIFKGDVYVAGTNFKLINQKIDGNLYFLNEEAQKTFTIQDKADDDKSVVTGRTELAK
jgi:hypothetical protein